ncbi:hypothetical protein CFAM422_001309 [Trichoderma lentiforme]|uniref:Uncharacterized protein n=1 Tax=Trichoderma lentiforme TaxID=1567552 RepID=A0A9P4XM51_9HYPO|nr:hypothetical protein CFAM422_001309 [Trichoderma lentiforme]
MVGIQQRQHVLDLSTSLAHVIFPSTLNHPHIITKQHLVKGDSLLAQLNQVLYRLVPQLRQIGNPSQFPLPPRRVDPPFPSVLLRLGYLIVVCRIRYLDPPRHVSLFKLAVQFSQCLLAIVPAAALENAHKHIIRAKSFRKLNDRIVPVFFQHLCVVPVHARNVYPLAWSRSPAAAAQEVFSVTMDDFVVDSKYIEEIDHE